MACYPVTRHNGLPLTFFSQWGFLARYGELFRFWLVLPIISVQPFTNVVASYTCQYRDKECNYVIHGHHLLPAGKSRQHLYHSITATLFLLFPLPLLPTHPGTHPVPRRNHPSGRCSACRLCMSSYPPRCRHRGLL